MTRKINWIRVIILVITIPLLLLVIIFQIADYYISYKENKYISEYIESKNLTQIKYTSIQKDNFGYKINFLCVEDDFNLCLKESIDIFNDLLNFLAKEDLSLNNKRLTFCVSDASGSISPIQLYNFNNNENFDFGKIISVKITGHMVNDLSVLNNINQNIQNIYLYEVKIKQFPKFSEFDNLKFLHLFNCYYLNKRITNQELLIQEGICSDINIQVD